MNDESLRRANALLAAMARQVAVGDIWSGAPSDLGRSAGIDDALAVARAMRALRSRGRLEQVGDGYRLLDGKPVEVGERGTIPPVERPARHAGPRAGRAKTDEGPTDPATGLSYAAIGREVVDRLIDLGKEVATLRAEVRGAKEEVREARTASASLRAARRWPRSTSARSSRPRAAVAATAVPSRRPRWRPSSAS